MSDPKWTSEIDQAAVTMRDMAEAVGNMYETLRAHKVPKRTCEAIVADVASRLMGTGAQQ